MAQAPAPGSTVKDGDRCQGSAAWGHGANPGSARPPALRVRLRAQASHAGRGGGAASGGRTSGSKSLVLPVARLASLTRTWSATVPESLAPGPGLSFRSRGGPGDDSDLLLLSLSASSWAGAAAAAAAPPPGVNSDTTSTTCRGRGPGSVSLSHSGQGC